MNLRPLFFLVLLFAAPALLAPTALAQDNFTSTVREGLREFEAGHWAEARLLFLQANDIRASAEALRMAGNASYENRDYVQSVEFLEQALAAEEGALRPDRIPMAQEALEAANRYVTRLTVQTQHETVLIDQRPIPANEVVLVARGRHGLQVGGVGFETQRQELDLREAEAMVNVSLQASVSDSQPMDTPPEVEEEESSRTGLWVALAVIGVAIAGGVVAAILLTRDDTPPLGANAPGSVVYTLGQP